MTAPHNQDPVLVVQSMYAAFAARDEACLRTLLAPDVSWRQCAGYPGGGSRHGVDEVLNGVFRGNRSMWRGFRAVVERYLGAGEHVVALGFYDGEHSVTGAAMHAVFAHVYRVQDGRIVEFDQYADTWPMVRAGMPG